VSGYREPTLFAETERFNIAASIHENGLSIEFRLFDKHDSEEGFWTYGGFLKWETNPECLAHYCKPDDHKFVGEAFVKVGELAREHVRSYEGSF
jgi:hypothetical protein